MRLLTLFIEEYKNIKNQTFDFSDHDGLTLLIGNNGSGKSNLLESISDIFSNLYQNQNHFETKGFVINYIIDGIIYSVKYENGNIEKRCNGEMEAVANPFILPKRIVAVYSGETSRLSNRFFKPIFDGIVQKQIHANPLSSALLRLPEMVYLDHSYWGLSLLSLLCSDADDIIAFCQNEIGIKHEDVVFEFNYAPQDGRNGYHNYTSSRILDFVKSFDSRTTYSVNEFIQCIESHGFQRLEVFELLYCAYLPINSKIITEINVKINDDFDVEGLSEGLKKRILIRAALEFASQENSLYLLDEPDAHVHLCKKRKVVEDINSYKARKQIVITSHSPTMCKYVGKDNPQSIIMLDHGEKKNISNVFEAGRMLSDDNQIFNLLFSTKHIVLTEGKTDCKYIKKALEFCKTDYPVLYNDTDYISVGGTDGEVIVDLLPRITDIHNRKIIVLVDRDTGGLKCAKKVLNNDNLKKDDIDVRQITAKQNASFIMIPSKDGSQKDFMVEDYFDHNKIEQLSIEYISTHFSGKNFGEFPKVKDDMKRTVLPNFCDSSTDPNDFIGFKILFDKIMEVF